MLCDAPCASHTHTCAWLTLVASQSRNVSLASQTLHKLVGEYEAGKKQLAERKVPTPVCVCLSCRPHLTEAACRSAC